MRKVCVVVTARASYARIKTVLEAIQARNDLELRIVAAASALLERYGNVAEVMAAEGWPPDYEALTAVDGGSLESMVHTTAQTASALGRIFAKMKPDCVVTIADRHETLGTAIAAAYQNINLVHVQGGESTGSIDDRVRFAITALADTHLVATFSAVGLVEHARLGILGGWKILQVGCPSVDLVARAKEHSGPLGMGVGDDLKEGERPLLVLFHPNTKTSDVAFAEMQAVIEGVRRSGYPAVWFWPNIDAGTDQVSKALRMYHEQDPPGQLFVRNLPPEQFADLAKRSAAIVGNSSFGIREASYLGLPAVNVGERQSGRERGVNVVDVPFQPERINAEIRRLANTRFPKTHLYGDGKAGERIARVLAGERDVEGVLPRAAEVAT